MTCRGSIELMGRLGFSDAVQVSLTKEVRLTAHQSNRSTAWFFQTGHGECLGGPIAMTKHLRYPLAAGHVDAPRSAHWRGIQALDGFQSNGAASIFSRLHVNARQHTLVVLGSVEITIVKEWR